MSGICIPYPAELRTMNLLMMADSFLPHAGGSRVYYFQVYKNLTERFGDRVTILTKKVAGWREFDAEVMSPALRIERRFRPLPDMKYWQWPKLVLPVADAVRLARRDNVELIHSGDLFPQGLIAMWLKRTMGLPYVAYCHGEEVTQTDLRRFQPRVRNHIYRNADCVIAASGFARENLLRIGVPEDRIRKITPGVECERFNPRPKNAELIEKYGLAGKTVLVTVARLIPRKGHEVVMRAMKHLLPQFPDLRYVMVGKGPQQRRLENLSQELGLGQVVTFTGRVPDEQLADHYNLCDIFVMPNDELEGDVEGFGMVFLEASAMGKPVVGGRSGGAVEAIEEDVTGLLANPKDPQDVAAALRTLLENPMLREAMGEAGARRARMDFSWASRAAALHQVNLDVLEAARRGKRQPDAVRPASPAGPLSSGRDALGRQSAHERGKGSAQGV